MKIIKLTPIIQINETGPNNHLCRIAEDFIIELNNMSIAFPCKINVSTYIKGEAYRVRCNIKCSNFETSIKQDLEFIDLTNHVLPKELTTKIEELKKGDKFTHIYNDKPEVVKTIEILDREYIIINGEQSEKSSIVITKVY